MFPTIPLRAARGLAGAAIPQTLPAGPQWPSGSDVRPDAYLSAARLLARADGRTLSALAEAAVALKRGNEAEARRLLAPLD